MSVPTNEPAPFNFLWTPDQAAEQLAVSLRTLWSLTAGGELPAVRIRRCVRYRPADVQAYIDRLAAEGRR